MSARQDLRNWVLSGDCPCCFPTWEYATSLHRFWMWQEEMDAWAIHESLNWSWDES